jgi:hypothetical protein
MYPVTGGCYCGNIRLQLELAHEPAKYHPRACDCGFCRKHAAAYVSDPEGSLRIVIHDSHYATNFRQGSERAEMLVCSRCGVLVGALYREDGDTYGTINARAIEALESFDTEQSVSPKQLSAEEKVARWKKLWFYSVEIVEGH